MLGLLTTAHAFVHAKHVLRPAGKCGGCDAHTASTWCMSFCWVVKMRQ